MSGPEQSRFQIRLAPSPSRAELLRNEQSLGAYLERERGELLATGEGAALSELDKIHAAMLERLGEPDSGSR